MMTQLYKWQVLYGPGRGVSGPFSEQTVVAYCPDEAKKMCGGLQLGSCGEVINEIKRCICLGPYEGADYKIGRDYV